MFRALRVCLTLALRLCFAFVCFACVFCFRALLSCWVRGCWLWLHGGYVRGHVVAVVLTAMLIISVGGDTRKNRLSSTEGDGGCGAPHDE